MGKNSEITMLEVDAKREALGIKKRKFCADLGISEATYYRALKVSNVAKEKKLPDTALDSFEVGKLKTMLHLLGINVLYYKDK